MKEIIIEEVPVSDCCGTEMYGGFLDVLICPSCREHCEVEIIEEETIKKGGQYEDEK